MNRKKIFFKGLNELRAIAALLVIFHHIELHIGLNSLSENLGIMYFTGNIGKNAVFLFFVMSGFLITYLLLNEKGIYDTISLKKFFLRRIFRIWPLYYLIVITSIILVPLLASNFEFFSLDKSTYIRIMDESNYNLKGVLGYLLFIPNVALNSGYLLIGSSQSWSVGVEEQFYLIWPFILLFFKKNKIIQIFIGVLIFIPILIYLSKENIIKYPLSVIFKSIPFHFMTFGAIAAYYYFHYKIKIENITASYISFALIIVLILLFLFNSILDPHFQEMVIGLLFSILVLFTINEKNTFFFRNSILSYLGKISYGIYMYHTFVMFLVFPVVNKYIRSKGLFYNIIIYLFVLIITFLLSSVSYKYFEVKFIKLKNLKYKMI